MEYFGSGSITHRGRKIGIVWCGQNAEHVMEEHLKMPSLHPFTHVRIQQLAKLVKVWQPAGGKRYHALVMDNESGLRVLIVADIYPKFALLITAVKR